MLDALEQLLNLGSDQDWSWYPLLALRPPKSRRLTAKVVLVLGALVSLAYFTVGYTALCLAAVLAHNQGHFRHLSFSHSTYVNAITRSGANHAWVLLLLAISGTLLCLPSAWAWNRRADRLSREAGLPQPAPAASGVWPPAPSDIYETPPTP